MHIPTHMISGTAVPQVTALCAAAGVASAAWYCGKEKNEKVSGKLFASVTAFIFAAQMMNFPVQNGTSGHLIGASLAVMLLGIPHAVLSMTIVLAVQTLAFADGGIDVMGSNIFNMALVAVAPAALAGIIAGRIKNVSKPAMLALVAAGAWLSVVLASISCALQLALSGTIDAGIVIPAMAGIHSLIGLGEALITLAAVMAFSKAPLEGVAASRPLPAPVGRKSHKLPLICAFAVALMMSPFASSYPDGLEWVAKKLGFLHESMPLFASPMSDYAVPFIANEAVSTSAAGLAGTVIVFACAYVVSALLRPRYRGAVS